jgi:L-fuconolactonase
MTDRVPTSGEWSAGQIRVDAHQHFWDIESGRYAWPTPDDGVVYRTFTPADLEPELAHGRIDSTVLVQTVNTLDDTDSMLAVADRHAFVGAVVGWVPLSDPRATERALDTRPDPRLRGIRHLIHHEPDPAWLLRDDVGGGLRVLSDRGLTLDIVAVFPHHLRLVPTIADRFPDLAIVIDHLAKPPFRSPGWQRWRDQIRGAAARPNVVAKISGLDTAAGPGWTGRELEPALDAALHAFGAERLMFGSDWPVCRLVSTYGEVLVAMEQLVAPLSDSERDAVMGETAARVYGIPHRARLSGGREPEQRHERHDRGQQ